MVQTSEEQNRKDDDLYDDMVKVGRMVRWWILFFTYVFIFCSWWEHGFVLEIRITSKLSTQACRAPSSKFNPCSYFVREMISLYVKIVFWSFFLRTYPPLTMTTQNVRTGRKRLWCQLLTDTGCDFRAHQVYETETNNSTLLTVLKSVQVVII